MSAFDFDALSLSIAQKGQVDAHEIYRALTLLSCGNAQAVREVRVLNVPKAHTVSGYFDDLKQAVKQSATYSGQAPGVYVTINPVQPDLLARAHNRVKPYAKVTTSDDGIARREWLLVDIDPQRPSGISATDEEKAAALAVLEHCRGELATEGWPPPVIVDSGNGYHAWYRIDLPNDQESTDLLRHILEALADLYDTPEAKVDRTTFNAARIVKLPGTLAAKGDPLPTRPHRLARILEIPDSLKGYLPS